MFQKSRLIAVPLFALSLVFACAKEEEKRTSSPAASESKPENPDLVQIDLKLDFTEEELNQLSPEKLAIAQRLNSSEKVSHNQLTRLFVDSHVEGYRKVYETPKFTVDQILGKLETVVKDQDVSRPGVFKKGCMDAVVAEREKASALSSDALYYNYESVSFVEMFQYGHLQCSSGTAFNMAAIRMKKNGKEFVEGHHVVLFEKGHVLSGVMYLIGGQWHLYGIENTNSSDQLIYMGPTKDLNIPIRVIDANFYVVYEIFKNDLESQSDLSQDMLQKTAKKYDIPLENTEKLIEELLKKEQKDRTFNPDLREAMDLNQFEMAFGTPENVPRQPVPLPDRQEKNTRGNVSFQSPEELQRKSSGSSRISGNGAAGFVFAEYFTEEDVLAWEGDGGTLLISDNGEVNFMPSCEVSKKGMIRKGMIRKFLTKRTDKVNGELVEILSFELEFFGSQEKYQFVHYGPLDEKKVRYVEILETPAGGGIATRILNTYFPGF